MVSLNIAFPYSGWPHPLQHWLLLNATFWKLLAISLCPLRMFHIDHHVLHQYIGSLSESRFCTTSGDSSYRRAIICWLQSCLRWHAFVRVVREVLHLIYSFLNFWWELQHHPCWIQNFFIFRAGHFSSDPRQIYSTWLMSSHFAKPVMSAWCSKEREK